MLKTQSRLWTLLASCVLFGVLSPLAAQQAPTTPATQTPATDDQKEPPKAAGHTASLADHQGQLTDKYRRLENLIFKMADFEATSNPRRAALLRQAYKQSKDRLTYSQLSGIAKLLSEQKYKRAIDGQEIAHKDMKDLLHLLLSEDRSDRLKSETQKIKEYVKELKRLERIQRGVRGRTEGASDPRELAKDQEKVADRTGDLAEQLEQDDAQSEQGKAGSEGKAEQGEGKKDSSDANKKDANKEDANKKETADDGEKGKENKNKKGDSQQSKDKKEANKKDADKNKTDKKAKDKAQAGKPSEGEQGKQGEPKEQDSSQSKSQKKQSQQGQSQQGQSSQGKQGEQKESDEKKQDDNPAKKRVREAEQKMREAQQKLEEAKRSESVEKQTEALEKLQEAIAELEEILRQLREEEMERVLALLEGRFRKMLEMELKVYEGTLRIEKIAIEKRGRTIDIRASKLAFDQRKIAGAADRALTLLLEEGSSIAFPEVVEQMRDDMEEVSARLDQVKVAEITRGLEEEIIATLEELIEALQKAQQDMEDGKPRQPGQPGAGGDPPLVDVLAELKMIRSLQVRVNSRTKRYARLLDDPNDPTGQAMADDLRRAIGKLSDLQSRIQQITRDIALGKNK